jgi:DNA-3-methyladenine glycosylase
MGHGLDLLSSDVVQVAHDLVGMSLFTHIDGLTVGGIITETEAYAGPEDKASHAYGNRRTKRTETMFQAGGIVYIYLCYGMHHLLNIVTNVEGIPHAVLIRALKPTHGIETMQERRKNRSPLAAGPGTLSQALGLTLAHNGIPIGDPTIWLEDRGNKLSIHSSPRIGIDYAEEWVEKPWRFHAY